MTRATTFIHEMSLPNPYDVDSIGELEPDVLRVFTLLAEADYDLARNGQLNEHVVLEKIEDIRSCGQLYVEREPESEQIRGALYGSMQPSGSTYDIELLAVDKLYRKQGIGSELLSQAAESARAFGATVLSLQAINTPGVMAFYIKEGFQPQRAYSRYYMPMSRTL